MQTASRSASRLFAFGAAGVLAALVLSGCATETPSLPPPPPPPLPVLPVPPAAVAPPPVTLSRQVIEQAGAYRIYMRRAAAFSPAFKDGAAVEQTLASAAAYEPKQFLAGAIAYAALVALQEPSFVAGVRTYAVDPDQRRMLAARLVSEPTYAAALPSASAAAGLVVAALNADGVKVRSTGELVKQAAYDVQHQAWSKGDVKDRPARLAAAKVVSAVPISTPEADAQALSQAVAGGDAATAAQVPQTGSGPIAAPFSPIVARGLSLAAVAALGEAGDANTASLQALLDEPGGGFCLNMAKLNLYQCLAVAKPYYEDVFCLGQHILMDTGQCIVKATGDPKPLVAAATAGPAPAAQ